MLVSELGHRNSLMFLHTQGIQDQGQHSIFQTEHLLKSDIRTSISIMNQWFRSVKPESFTRSALVQIFTTQNASKNKNGCILQEKYKLHWKINLPRPTVGRPSSNHAYKIILLSQQKVGLLWTMCITLLPGGIHSCIR